MNKFLEDPRFAGVEPFSQKIWWCLYNRTEIKKMPTASGFFGFSAYGKTFEKLSESLQRSEKRRVTGFLMARGLTHFPRVQIWIRRPKQRSRIAVGCLRWSDFNKRNACQDIRLSDHFMIIGCTFHNQAKNEWKLHTAWGTCYDSMRWRRWNPSRRVC